MADGPFTPEQVEQRCHDYRVSCEVGRRIMDRPGFLERLARRRAELAERYGT